MKRYCVIRVPSSGPPALAGAPNVFETREEAEARVAEIESTHLMRHHTWLDVIAVDDPVTASLQARGISV